MRQGRRVHHVCSCKNQKVPGSYRCVVVVVVVLVVRSHRRPWRNCARARRCTRTRRQTQTRRRHHTPEAATARGIDPPTAAHASPRCPGRRAPRASEEQKATRSD
jgi:hypothetical protein